MSKKHKGRRYSIILTKEMSELFDMVGGVDKELSCLVGIMLGLQVRRLIINEIQNHDKNTNNKQRRQNETI